MKIKKKEFLSLRKGGMSVAEYRDKFTELSRYATEEVAEDRNKQELFLDGLASSLQYQLMSYLFPNFQQLVYAAIRLEHKRKELGEQKRNAASSRQFGSASRPRFNPPPNTPFRFGGPCKNFGQQQSQCPAQQFQQSAQQFQRPFPQTPRPASQLSQQRAPVGTPVRSVASPNPATTTCFKCGELGHYANACPKRNPPHTPVQNQQQTRSGNQSPQNNKGQQSYARGKAMHVDAEIAHENPRVVLGIFLVNSTPASVLFDFGASHSFITSQFVAQHNIPISPMSRHILVSSPGGIESHI
jgi:hypothetical protein